MSIRDNYEVKDTKTLLKLLKQDITNQDFDNVRVKVEAIMENEFHTIRNRREPSSRNVTKELMTAVRRLEKIDPVFAMETATYIENVAGAANPTEYNLRSQMANKVFNIADRLTKQPGATKELFNKAAKAVNTVRNWNTYEVTMKGEKIRNRVYNRAQKRGFNN